MPGTSGPFSPRLVDHEAMALVVASYRVIDAYLNITQSLPQAPSKSQRLTHSRGPHVVDDWVDLAQSFAALMRRGGAGTVESDSSSSSSPSTGNSQAAALLKRMIRSGRNATVWRIFSNIYSCATFLVSLCEETSVQDPFTIARIQGSFQDWCERASTSDPSGLLSGEEKQQLLSSISSPNSVKGIQLCMETAFLGSPILLLQTFDISKKTWTRESILKTTRCLGNNKPVKMTEVEHMLFLSIFEIAFSGCCCSHSLLKSVDVIERELADRTLALPNWFLPPPEVRYLNFIPNTPLASHASGGNSANEDESGRPPKRRRTDSPDRRSAEGPMQNSLPANPSQIPVPFVPSSPPLGIQSTVPAAGYPTPEPSVPPSDLSESLNMTLPVSHQARPAWTMLGQTIGLEAADIPAPWQAPHDQTSPSLTLHRDSQSTSVSAALASRRSQSPVRQDSPSGSVRGRDFSISPSQPPIRQDSPPGSVRGRSPSSRSSSKNSSRLSTPPATPPPSSRPLFPGDESGAPPNPNPKPDQNKDGTTSKDEGSKDKNPKDKNPKEKNPKDKNPKDKNPKDKNPKDKNPKDKNPKGKDPKNPNPKTDGKKDKKGKGKGDDKGKGVDKGEGPTKDGVGKPNSASVPVEVELLTREELDDVFEDLNITKDDRPAHRITAKGIPFTPTGEGSLPPKKLRRIPCDTPFKIYDIDGIEEEYLPVTSRAELAILKKFFKALESFYVEGKPRHVSRPEDSIFRRITPLDEDAITMDPGVLRAAFSGKYLVVRGESPTPMPRFDQRQLNKVLPLHTLVSISDYSLDEGEGGEASGREVEGTLQQVLDEHMKGDQGKILNILDIKRDGAVTDHPLFSDVRAYRETKNVPLPFDKFDFPVHDHSWHLVATKDARHGWHIDPAGLCTYIEVVAGMKLWAVAVPPPESKKTRVAFFGDFNRFFKKWLQDLANGERWRIEAVLLRAGDKLLFDAMCVHMVITITSAICSGGHFYSATNMTETAASKILSFLLENTITNTEHSRSQHLLQLQAVHHFDRLLCHGVTSGFLELGYDLDRFSDWHSFTMFHVLTTLGPALDPRFYPSHKKWGQASEYDCLMLAYGRGASLRVMARIGGLSCLKISIPGKPHLSPRDYFEDVLLKQAILFVRAFDAAQAENTLEFSDLRMEVDRPHLVRMLREALSHDAQLLIQFDRYLKGPEFHKPSASVMAVPLPPQGASCLKISRMTTGGSITYKHNPDWLIRHGLTPTLHPTLRRYHQEVVIVKKEQKDREL